MIGRYLGKLDSGRDFLAFTCRDDLLPVQYYDGISVPSLSRGDDPKQANGDSRRRGCIPLLLSVPEKFQRRRNLASGFRLSRQMRFLARREPLPRPVSSD